jgi:hypothetical protein
LNNNNSRTAFVQDNLISKEEMSDEEFCDPLAAINHWNKNKAKRVFVPDKTSVFRWNKASKLSDSAENNTGESKIIESSAEISDDLSDVSVSDDSVNKEIDSNKISTINDVPPIDLNNEKSSKNIINVKLIKKLDKLKSFAKYEEIYNNIELPSGMPPIIAGVPVMFPITPYKSQISVMNAVSIHKIIMIYRWKKIYETKNSYFFNLYYKYFECFIILKLIFRTDLYLFISYIVSQ